MRDDLIDAAGPAGALAASTDLVISRTLRAPRAALWRAWSEPHLLKDWWCPKPWTTEVRAMDLTPGGAFHTVMHGPDGGTSDNPGCFLEIVPGLRVVFTSMLTAGWRPHAPWLGFTAVITMTDADSGTLYTARVMHQDDAAREQHEKLGFFEGWNIVITQLDDLACTLA